MTKFYEGTGSEAVFDENYFPLSYHDDGTKLKGIEVAIKNGNDFFLLSVMTADLYTNRIVGDEYGDDNVYVLPTDEIYPSDLMRIKQTPFEQLKDFLDQQQLPEE